MRGFRRPHSSVQRTVTLCDFFDVVRSDLGFTFAHQVSLTWL